MKKKNEDDKIDVKVIFHKTYIGKLGNYYKGVIYNLPYELYMVFKNDCKEVE